jgi:transcription initiation factor TFIIB
VLTFELDLQVPILDPIQCIAKVANTAMINESTRRLAFGLLRELLSSKILTVGKNPMGLAASILYIASKEMGEIYLKRNWPGQRQLANQLLEAELRT